MYKVTALSVLLAAMGVGSAFAGPMDVDFNSLDLAVNKGSNDVYGVKFDVNIADFNTEYECENVLKGRSMDVCICYPSSPYFVHTTDGKRLARYLC